METNHYTDGRLASSRHRRTQMCYATGRLRGTSAWQRVQRREEEDKIEDIERDKRQCEANRDEAGDDARDGESAPFDRPLRLLDFVQANETEDNRQNRQD